MVGRSNPKPNPKPKPKPTPNPHKVVAEATRYFALQPVRSRLRATPTPTLTPTPSPSPNPNPYPNQVRAPERLLLTEAAEEARREEIGSAESAHAVRDLGEIWGELGEIGPEPLPSP